MSSVRAPFRLKRAPDNIATVNRKVPENPRYSHVGPIVDSGASIRRYLEKLKESQKNVNYRKGEVFKRIKLTTFVKLIIEVVKESLNNQTTEEEDAFQLDLQCASDNKLSNSNQTSHMSPPSHKIQSENTLAETPRSTFHSVVNGIGELDLKYESSNTNFSSPHKEPIEQSPSPYLLLDVRDKSDYELCHIVTARSYPYTMLCRSCNYETKDLFAYKNLPERIIVMYDEDELIASRVATTFVQRGYENVFMLTGGLKLAAEKFPHRFITGTIPPSCLPSVSKKQSSTSRGSITTRYQNDLSNMNVSAPRPEAAVAKDSFNRDDLDVLQAFLEGYAFTSNLTGQRSSLAAPSRINTATARQVTKNVRPKTSTLQALGKPRPWK